MGFIAIKLSFIVIVIIVIFQVFANKNIFIVGASNIICMLLFTILEILIIFHKLQDFIIKIIIMVFMHEHTTKYINAILIYYFKQTKLINNSFLIK